MRGGDGAAKEEDEHRLFEEAAMATAERVGKAMSFYLPTLIIKNNISKNYLPLLQVPILLVSSSATRGYLVDGEDSPSTLENNTMMQKNIPDARFSRSYHLYF